MHDAPSSQGRFLRASWLLLAALTTAALGACDEDPAPAAKPDVASGDGSVGSDGTSPLDGADDVADTQVPDTATDTPDVGPDDADAAEDAPPPDVPQCTTTNDCSGLTLLACEQAACVSGTCKAVPKPYPSCCDDSACDDKNECTTDKCDTSAHQCVSASVPNCCSGKVTFLKAGFEGSGDELKAAGTTAGVGWQVAQYRAHSGKSAFYFGNACKTYDSSMTPEGGCKPGKDGSPVTGTATSKDYTLPVGKSAHLLFWLWLDAEPPLTASLKPGKCAPGCPIGSACVQVSDVAQCVPEKDVLSLRVVAGDQATEVFNSLSIGKTTAGQWKHLAVDLTPWAGQQVKLEWQFATGTALNNAYEGAYLDDVVVETVCAGAGTACDAQSPCKDDGNPCTAEVCNTYVNAPADATTTGACLYDKAPGCCTSAVDCDDASACTTDTCEAGKCSSVPDASKPGCCKAEGLAFDDFDGGVLDGWTPLNANSNLVQWRLQPKGGKDGTGALYFGTENGDSYSDTALLELGPKGTICTKPVVLGAGTLYNLLSFDLKMETEWSGAPPEAYVNPPIPGLPKFDVLTIQLFQLGEFTDAWSSDIVYGTTEGAWLPVTVPLDAWQGKTVQVCLTFDAGDGQKNAFQGVSIDNFVLKIACSKKACYLPGECKSLACKACETAQCTESGCACVKTPNCCSTEADCDDGDKCTQDLCVDLACAHSPTGAEGCATP